MCARCQYCDYESIVQCKLERSREAEFKNMSLKTSIIYIDGFKAAQPLHGLQSQAATAYKLSHQQLRREARIVDKKTTKAKIQQSFTTRTSQLSPL